MAFFKGKKVPNKLQNLENHIMILSQVHLVICWGLTVIRKLDIIVLVAELTNDVKNNYMGISMNNTKEHALTKTSQGPCTKKLVSQYFIRKSTKTALK